METGPGRAGGTTPPEPPGGPPAGVAADHAPSAAEPDPASAPGHVPPPSLDATLPDSPTTARERERLGLVEEKTRAWPIAAVARGLALFCGAFTLLNVVGALRTPGFDENIWWIDLHLLPQAAAVTARTAAAGSPRRPAGGGLRAAQKMNPKPAQKTNESGSGRPGRKSPRLHNT